MRPKEIKTSLKRSTLLNKMNEDPWFRWLQNNPHEGIPLIACGFNRICIRPYTGWGSTGVEVFVYEVEQRNSETRGEFIRPRRVISWVWPSTNCNFANLRNLTLALARLTDGDIDQADIDVTAPRIINRLKELHKKGKLIISTQEERRKAPRPKTSFKNAGKGKMKCLQSAEPKTKTEIPLSHMLNTTKKKIVSNRRSGKP